MMMLLLLPLPLLLWNTHRPSRMFVSLSDDSRAADDDDDSWRAIDAAAASSAEEREVEGAPEVAAAPRRLGHARERQRR